VEIHLIPEGLGPTWPQRPFAADASLGVSVGPPTHLLEVLETALGLSGKFLDPAMRAAALVPAVRRTPGFFAASARADALGVAKTMLRWRDRLWLHGWRAEPVTPRLADLAAVTLTVEPGVPDRLLAVLAALGERNAGIERLVLIESPASLPWLWREVLDALEHRGTHIEVREPTPVAARGDLQRVRLGQAPRGDGAIQLLRCAGPRVAADAVAAWLAAQDDWRDTVIIGGDAVLDHALRRHGLPTTGRHEAGDRPVAQALRLTLALGWRPADPQRAYELLTLPGGPVPAALARPLLHALHVWPAVDSDAWRRATAEGLASILDAERRRRVEQRLQTLFEVQTEDAYPVTLARRKAEAVLHWSRREKFAGGAAAADHEAAEGVARRFLELLDTADGPTLAPPELEQLLKPAEATVVPPPFRRREAGLVAIADPGALIGPAKRVVWWSFSRERTPMPRFEIPLYPDEVEVLERRGVRLPPPSDQALRDARRWHRPLEQTSDTLLLVCPHRGANGEALHVHPLWDQIAARVPSRALVVDAPTAGQAIPRVVRPSLRPATPRRSWRVSPNSIRARRTPESPSSLALLLGCSLAYALRYAAELRRSTVSSLPDEERLLGTLAHQLLADALAHGRGKAPHELAHDVVTAFERDGVRFAARLFRPGADAERAKIRGVLERATSALAELLDERALEVVGTERRGRSTIAGRSFEGVADLLLGRSGSEAPVVVVDLKWGGATRHRQMLERGVATQLASYARCFRGSEPYPDIAYFILKDSKWLARSGATWIDGSLEAPEAAATWAAFEASVRKAFEVIAEGSLEAPGNPDADGNVVTEPECREGQIVLAPPCGFCEFSALCGRVFEEDT